MKKLLMACLLALPLVVLPTKAWAWSIGCSKGGCEGDAQGCKGDTGDSHGCKSGHCFAPLHSCCAKVHGCLASLCGKCGIHRPGLIGGGGDHEHASNVPQAGPWYLYWPYLAHFQTPAPLPYPYYTPTMTLPPNFQGGFQGGAQPFQPVGYNPQAAPAYWQPH